MSALAEPCPPSNRTHETLIDERVRLLNNGFTPTPCDGKRALLDGWASLHVPTVPQIEGWEETHPRCRNTGLLTRLNPAFDIDTPDEDAAQALEDLTRQRFGDLGRILVRGRQESHKRAIPFQCADPFKKIAVPFVEGGKLELLGDGQQFIAFGDHPDTRRPYVWENGDSPLSVRRSDLPPIAEDEARAHMADSVKLLVDHFGFQVLKPPRPEPPPGPIVTAPFCGGSRYGAAALAGACAAITCAPCGDQESTLNRESFSIGQLVGAGVIDQSSAISRPLSAASAMPSYDSRRPWGPREVVDKVNRAFAQGQCRPRTPVRGAAR
jgi:Bifunctional DNA primase/polymerase, N-terminal